MSDNDENEDGFDEVINKLTQGMSEEERKVVEAMLETMPDDIKDRIRRGEGQLVVTGGVNGTSPFQTGLSLMVSALTEVMSAAMMAGQDPEKAGMAACARELGVQTFKLTRSFPLQMDLIFKSLICGMAAAMELTPKAFLETVAEGAPDEHLLQIAAEASMSPGDPTEIKELNELFNLPTAEEPTMQDNDNNDDNTNTETEEKN